MIRFKKDDGSSYPDLEQKQLKDILVERNTKQCISEDAPLLSFTIEQGVIDPSEKKTNKRDFLTKDMATKKYALIEYNDIIYNPSNIIYGAIGRNKLRRGVVSPIYAIFKTSELPEYVEWLVSNKNFINKSLKYLEGTVVKLRTLKPDDFLEIEIMLPCKEEQQKIADFLSSVDDVISIIEKEIVNLEEQKKGVMQKIFSQEVRFKTDDGFDYPDWEEKKLKDCCNGFDNKRKPVSSNQREAGDIPYYGANGIQDYVKEYIFDDEYVLLAEDGGHFDEFATRPIAQYINGKAWVNNHAHVLQAKENCLTKYVFFQLVHKDIRKYINGTSRAKLNQEDMWSIKIKVPCLEEQQKIADFLSDFDTAIEKAKEELVCWKEIKKGLLQQLFE